MTKVISVMNYKGGVGKTTLTANIGAELAYQRFKVLMIDLDPQSSLTFSFVTPDDWKSHLSNNRTIKEWFNLDRRDNIEFKKLIFTPQKTSLYMKENQGGALQMVASHLDLINLDLDLATELSGASKKQIRKSFFKVYTTLLKGINSLNGYYDYVLIDCPPNFNIITKNAIVASDYVLVPARPDYLSTLGITYLRRNLNDLIKEYNQYCSEQEEGENYNSAISTKIVGVVFTMVQLYNSQPINVQRQYIREVIDSGVPVFKSYMRDNKSIFAEAPQYLLPVVLNKRSNRTDIVRELENITKELKKKSHG